MTFYGLTADWDQMGALLELALAERLRVGADKRSFWKVRSYTHYTHPLLHFIHRVLFWLVLVPTSRLPDVCCRQPSFSVCECVLSVSTA